MTIKKANQHALDVLLANSPLGEAECAIPCSGSMLPDHTQTPNTRRYQKRHVPENDEQ